MLRCVGCSISTGVNRPANSLLGPHASFRFGDSGGMCAIGTVDSGGLPPQVGESGLDQGTGYGIRAPGWRVRLSIVRRQRSCNDTQCEKLPNVWGCRLPSFTRCVPERDFGTSGLVLDAAGSSSPRTPSRSTASPGPSSRSRHLSRGRHRIDRSVICDEGAIVLPDSGVPSVGPWLHERPYSTTVVGCCLLDNHPPGSAIRGDPVVNSEVYGSHSAP